MYHGIPIPYFFTINYQNKNMGNQTTTTRTALKWGVIAGVISIVASSAAKFFQASSQPSMGMSFLIFFVMAAFTCVILVFAMNDFKKQNNGYMAFGQGLGIGTLSGAVYGIISGGFQLFYTKFIDDSEIRTQMNKMREQMESQNAPESQIETTEKMMSFMQNPGFLFVSGILLSVLAGFLFSLIIAAIVKKDKSVFE
jgi:uncharacterized integral membrane protein